MVQKFSCGTRGTWRHAAPAAGADIPHWVRPAAAVADPAGRGLERQQRVAAQYEKRVLAMNAWGQKQGYPPFCEVVTQEDGLVNKTDTPNKGWEKDRVPTCTSRIL